MFPQVLRAGEWFLQSGIQNSDGGVARYYRLDLGRNQAVSTEITGYTASALAFLASLTTASEPERSRYSAAARSAARFLCNSWDRRSGAMPFEVDPPQLTYFFDCGIIVRGLLAVWRATGEQEFLDCARQVGHSMAHDFRDDNGGFHPILTLPDKRPLERNALRWSRSKGCYQLKAAMAWWDLWEATGDPCYRELFLVERKESLRTRVRLSARTCRAAEGCGSAARLPLLSGSPVADAIGGARGRDRTGRRAGTRVRSGVRAVRRVCATAPRADVRGRRGYRAVGSRRG
ncbi:MAG: hypothetical protein WDO73_13845 [Ignavibacteriota bacterium]